MVVWLLLELKPNCQHYDVWLFQCCGRSCAVMGTRLKVPTLGDTLGGTSHFWLGSQKCNKPNEMRAVEFFKTEQPLSELQTKCGTTDMRTFPQDLF